MENKETSLKTSYLLKYFAPYVWRYKGIMFADFFAASLTTVCELVLPLIVQYITFMGTNDLEGLTLNSIFVVGAGYLALRFLDAAANYYMQRTGHIMGAKIETDMRRDIFTHLHKLPYEFYDNTKIGQLMGRITSDLFDITEFAHHCPEEYFIAFLKITISFTILINIHVPLTLIMFAIIPVMLLFAMVFRKRMRKAFKDSRSQIGELNSQVEDSLLGVRVVKSFNSEELEKEKFEKGNEGFLEIKKDVYKYMAGFFSTTRFFDGIMYITVVVVGAIYMKQGEILASDLVAYLLYATVMLATIRRIVDFTEQFQKGITGLERFVEIMEVPIYIADAEDAVDMGVAKGNIDIKNVNFAYKGAKELALKDVNLTIEAGEKIALVGSSGGGKTTLSNLINRFYEIDDGSICIDGFDNRKVTQESLRRNIGIVQQDVYLFSGTIKDNIAYGKSKATDREIIAAAKMAGIDKFVESLPDKYNTYVGERGTKLSGGQRQRISIARVFLKNPPILILDEATSALDTESEKIIQESLEKLSKGRTTITIAHRLSTIRNADKIAVIEGSVVETGTHEELMEKKGTYYTLNK